jgi:cell division protein FtsI (penicillin-binding protein 3)
VTNKTKVNTRQQILLRARFIFGLVLVFGLSIIYSIFKLQNGYEKEFSTELKKKNTRIKTVNGIRGNIYADDGGLLATSVPTYDLIWDANVPGLLNVEFENKIDSLSNLFSSHIPTKTPSYWRNKLKSLRSQKVRYYKLAVDINFDLVKSMKTWPLIRKGKFKGGFWFEEKGKRMYFLGELAKRAIGYTRNGVNIGLEGAFDSLLRGSSAQIMEQRMPGNIWRPVSIGNDAVAENGKDIVTTLDVGFQDITQYALNKALVEHQADHGCVIVMDVKTGAIKAIANLKRGNDGKYYESQNYAVDQFSEPGSTFKIISALALLEDKKAVSTDSVPTKNGIIKYYNTPITDGSDHAITKKFYTLEECIEKSSNVGVSQFIFNAYQKNPEEFIEFILGLGLNIKPNFDIKSSNFPVIHDPKSADWSGVTLPSMSIGYSLKISPLQTLMIYNAIANKGALMNPYLVKEIRRDGQQLETIEPKVLKKKICSEKTLLSLQKMLEGVVSDGTAKASFKECLYPVAGKTGTARISNERSGYSKKHMSSFVGYSF